VDDFGLTRIENNVNMASLLNNITVEEPKLRLTTVGKMVLLSLFHGDNMGSNPIGDAKESRPFCVSHSSTPFLGDSVVTK
jgi:hypothetical protein